MIQWNKLKDTRVRNNHTQRDLCRLTELSINTIIQLEKNVDKNGYRPNISTIHKITKYIKEYEHKSTNVDGVFVNGKILFDIKNQVEEIKSFVNNKTLSKTSLYSDYPLNSGFVCRLLQDNIRYVTEKTKNTINQIIADHNKRLSKANSLISIPNNESTHAETVIHNTGISEIIVTKDSIIFKYER